MDPASIIALAGSAISIVDVIGRSLSFLLELQTKSRNANLTVSLLIGQLSTLKAALNQISEWITTSLVGVPRHEQLIADLDVSLEACKVLVLLLDDRIFHLKSSLTSQVAAVAKAHFLWEEKGMNDYLNLLNNQINALNLLLTALQCRTLFEQRDLLQSSESRHIIKMVEDDTSSLVWIRDTESYSCYSRKSALTEESVTLDTVFDFDREIFHSKAYQTAARSNMKQALKKGKRINVQHEVSHLTSNSGLATFLKHDDADQDVQAINGGPSDSSEPLANTSNDQSLAGIQPALNWGRTELDLRLQSLGLTDYRMIDVAHNGLDPEADGLDEMPKRLPSDLLPRPLNYSKPLYVRPGKRSFTDIGRFTPLERPFSPESKPIGRSHNAEESLMESKKERRRPWGWSSVLKTRTIQQTREESLAAAINRAKRDGRQRNEAVEMQLMQDRVNFDKENKSLLLGTSRSGKTTLLRSMKLLLEGAYCPDELESFKEIIFSNVTKSMRCILEDMERLQVPLVDQRAEYHVQTIFMQPPQMEMESLPPEVTDAIRALLKDSYVLTHFRNFKDHLFVDNAEYYFNSLSRIGQSQYVPIEQDILRSYVRTTGISETTFLTESGYTARIFDVGGTRAQRKKWIHCFENVDAIFFCVDISAYDQMIFDVTNEMQEALMLFDSICNSRWFTKTDMILIFTKTDLLESKLAIAPIRNYFPEYSDDPTDPHAVIKYIYHRFVQLNHHPEKEILLQFSDIGDVRKTATMISGSIDNCIKKKEMALTHVG